MFRRDFIHRLTLAAASAGTGSASETRTVSYRVRGFSCLTCAVGLETLLRKQKGVLRAKASYPGGLVDIEFDPAVLTEESLRTAISEIGFSVEEYVR